MVQVKITNKSEKLSHFDVSMTEAAIPNQKKRKTKHMPVIAAGFFSDIFAAFAIGTFWFWGLIAFFIIGSIIAEERDSGGWLTFTLLVVAVFLIPNLLPVVSVKMLLTGFVCYLVAGAVWSVVKFKKLVTSVVNKVKDDARYDYERELKISSNKTKLIGWIAAWPPSVFWTLTHDIFEWIYDSLRGVYESIAKSGVTKIEAIKSTQTK